MNVANIKYPLKSGIEEKKHKINYKTFDGLTFIYFILLCKYKQLVKWFLLVCSPPIEAHFSLTNSRWMKALHSLQISLLDCKMLVFSSKK